MNKLVALRKQLENLKIIKAEKEQAKKEKKEEEEKPKKEKLALKKEIEDKIIALGAEPITKKNEIESDEELEALKIN